MNTEIHRIDWFNKSVLYYSIFIYLNFIIDKSHSKIADIGCGYNFLKKYFLNVIGYDKNNFADYNEFFDDNFIIKHYEEFDVAVSVNSLHFISMKEFSKRINDFGKIIKPNGYGFITFNVQRMIAKTDKEFLQNFINIKNFYDYFNQEIEKINYKIIAYDNLILHNQKIKEKKIHDLYKILHGESWPTYNDIINNRYNCEYQEILKEINDYEKLVSIQPNYALYDPHNGIIRIIFKKQ
jgi:hypothetical protein